MLCNDIVIKLGNMLPDIHFQAADGAGWDPAERIIYYKPWVGDVVGVEGWNLAHECGHAVLSHSYYKFDLELLGMEAAAWKEAGKIADMLGMELNIRHEQKCLKSYSDWQNKRSKCPTCELVGLQIKADLYWCWSCDSEWLVSRERFSRCYRVMN